MKRGTTLLPLLLALAVLAACGTSRGGSGGVGATAAAAPELESATSVLTERDEPELADYDQLFWDNDGYYVQPKNGLDDSGMVLGDGFRIFDRAAPALVSAGALPELEGFPAPSIWVRYDEAQRPETARIAWTTAGADGYADRSMGLYVWPEPPDAGDPYFKQYQADHYTATDMGGAAVIGVGRPDTWKLLYAPLAHGAYCQIEANDKVTAGEMGAVLDFLLEHGFDFSQFDYADGEAPEAAGGIRLDGVLVALPDGTEVLSQTGPGDGGLQQAEWSYEGDSYCLRVKRTPALENLSGIEFEGWEGFEPPENAPYGSVDQLGGSGFLAWYDQGRSFSLSMEAKELGDKLGRMRELLLDGLRFCD